jgi:Flp pilus assembly protein TadD
MNINQNHFHQTNAGRNSYDEIQLRLNTLPLDEAIRLAEEFIKASPDCADAHNDLGVLYYRVGNKLQTLGHYEKAVRLSPQNTTFRKNIASFYFVEMAWTDEAIGIYTQILKSYPNDIEVLTALGIISNAVGRKEEARIFLRRVIELEPWNNEARQALAGLDHPTASTLETLANEQSGIPTPASVSEIDEILASLRTPSSSSNEKQSDLYLKAMKLAEDGMIEHAIADLNCLLRTNLHDSLLHNDLGVLYTRIGDITNALFHHEKAVALAPASQTFKKNLAGILYSTAGRADDAISLYTALLKEFPDDVEVLGALALICIDNKRTDEAMIFLDRILELEPTNADARRLADLMRNGGDKDFFLAAG